MAGGTNARLKGAVATPGFHPVAKTGWSFVNWRAGRSRLARSLQRGHRLGNG